MASEELAPTGEEVLDGEIVQPVYWGIRWEEWEDFPRMVKCFKLEITDEWFHRAQPWEINELEVAIETLKVMASRYVT